jgi:hypothetical protein
MFFFLAVANELNEAKGSDPGLNMKINGEVDEESAYILAKSKGGGEINFSPS